MNKNQTASIDVKPLQNRVLLIIASLCSLCLAAFCSIAIPAISHGENMNEHMVTYTVRSGDTLWELAQQGDSATPINQQVERIRRLNDLHSYDLQVGQTLVVPVDAQSHQ